MTSPQIPNILLKIVEYLKKQDIQLVAGGDARINSANSEAKIISFLQNHPNSDWQVISPNIKNNRSWYDFICIDKNTKEQYYCDIKISNCNSNDNMNAKKAIYWLLTGAENVERVPDQNKAFFASMSERENLSEERDFYYLVVNKLNNKDIFIVSLRNINPKAIHGSHNNPPFQANWGLCRDKQLQRTMQDAKDYFLKEWAKVIETNIKNLQEAMPQYYSEYFSNDITEK